MINIPGGLILFISGVPGVGKTTISYELLKRIEQFRIIEETDLMRDILRGYNDFLTKEFGSSASIIFDTIKISGHNKLLTLDEAKAQCRIMKNSIEQIVLRQQRKSIATIINGVHIIPEILQEITSYSNVIFINLYISDEKKIYHRIFERDPHSYMLKNIPLIYKTNVDLYMSTKNISKSTSNIHNIDVTNLSIEMVIERILSIISI